MQLNIFTRFALCLAVVAFSACSRQPDFSALVSDAAGLRVGDPVLFAGTEAGQVAALSPSQGKIKIDVRLKPAFQQQIRIGAKARAACDITSGFSSQLRIVGGTDTKKPLLPNGEILPEATSLDVVGEVMRGVAVEGGQALREGLDKLKTQAADEALKQLDYLRESIQDLRQPTQPSDSSGQSNAQGKK